MDDNTLNNLTDTIALKERNLIAPLIEQYAVNEGPTETICPGLILGRSSRTTPRLPFAYNPCICLVGQGKKNVYTDKDMLTYDPLHYLVVSLPMPLETQIVKASEEQPLLALILEIDISIVGKLLLNMDNNVQLNKNTPAAQAIYASPLNNELLNAFVRLLRLLDKPEDLRILGEGIINEILYYVLKGEQGTYLRALALQDNSSLRIAKVVRYINENYDKSLNIKSIADYACMGQSTLHHAFEKTIGQSPIQYLKKIRLHNARVMISSKGMNISEAAYKVGYNNISQFSREFKRQFGHAPSGGLAAQ